MHFAELLAAAEPLADGYRLAIPESWHQGRTAYGGLTAALALSAALRAGSEDLPALRSAQMSFAGPLFGPVEVRARVLRSGRNATWIAAEVIREGAAGLLANLVFMRGLNSVLSLKDCAPPAGLIAPNEAAPFAETRHGPAFRRNHMEVRFAVPRTAEKRPELCWWVRLKQRACIDPMAELLLIADALPPGVLPLLPPGTPLSSMQWQTNLLTTAPATREGWWLLRSASGYAENGCSSQTMAVWNADGEPVASGMQSIAMFG